VPAAARCHDDQGRQVAVTAGDVCSDVECLHGCPGDFGDDPNFSLFAQPRTGFAGYLQYWWPEGFAKEIGVAGAKPRAAATGDADDGAVFAGASQSPRRSGISGIRSNFYKTDFRTETAGDSFGERPIEEWDAFDLTLAGGQHRVLYIDAVEPEG